VNPILPLSTPEVWRAWKQACAADLCDAETAAVLRRFGQVRFGGYIRRAGHQVPEARDAWHLFESTCQVTKTRAGKRYKDWLFARADMLDITWLEAIESGASLLMRYVVREFLRREHSPSFMQSIQKTVGDGSVTLEELLPDSIETLGGIDETEMTTMAQHLAGQVFPTLDKTERALIWAKLHSVPFSDPRIMNKTRLGKSVLHDRFDLLIRRLTEIIRRTYPNETHSVTTSLIIYSLTALGKMLPDKLFSGKPRISML